MRKPLIAALVASVTLSNGSNMKTKKKLVLLAVALVTATMHAAAAMVDSVRVHDSSTRCSEGPAC